MSDEFSTPFNPEDARLAELIFSARAHLPQRQVISRELIKAEDELMLHNIFSTSKAVKTNPYLFHTVGIRRDDMRTPIELVESWVPLELLVPDEVLAHDYAAALASPPLIPLKHRAERVIETVTIATPSEEEASLLEVLGDTSLLHFWQYYYTPEDEGLLVQRRVYPPGQEVVYRRNLAWERQLDGVE